MSLFNNIFGKKTKNEKNESSSNSKNSSIAKTSELVLEAAKKGDVEALRRLLDAGSDLNIKDNNSQGWTPLMFSIDKGQIKAFEFLIESGVDINTKAATGTSALMVAALKPNVQIVNRLIQENVDLGTTDMNGKTALDLVNQMLKVLGQDKELTFIRDALMKANLSAKSLTEENSKKESQTSSNKQGNGKEFDSYFKLLNAFRTAIPSQLEDDGVFVKRKCLLNPGSSSISPIGDDDKPAKAILKIPGGITKIRQLCSEQEIERLLIVAEDYENPEWYENLIETPTQAIIGCLIYELCLTFNEAEKAHVLAKNTLISIGTLSNPRLKLALQKNIANGNIRVWFRNKIIEVLKEIGDNSCIPIITLAGTSDPALTDVAKTAITAISSRHK